jgi:hypothetical protein
MKYREAGPSLNRMRAMDRGTYADALPTPRMFECELRDNVATEPPKLAA